MNTKWRRTDGEIADAMGFDRQTIFTHRKRLGLPTNHRPMPAYAPQEASRPPKERQNPMKVAQIWLGKRLVEKPSGYFLDGVPVNLTSIMQATNRVLKAAGAEQISTHPLWVV
jgi:hypothetical protein